MLSAPSHGQNYGRRQRQGSRTEGGGLAFIMDNWLFRQSDAQVPSSTESDEPLTTATDGREYRPSAPTAYSETNWNPPVSLNSRGKVLPEETTEAAVTEEAKKSTAVSGSKSGTISVQSTKTAYSTEQPQNVTTGGTEPSLPASPQDRMPVARSRGPSEGDVRLEGGDVEGTGNVVIFR